MHEQFIAGSDADFAELLVAREQGEYGDLAWLTVALDGEHGLPASVRRDAGAHDERFHDVVPVGEFVAVDGEDAVADLEAGLRGGTGDLFSLDVLDGRGDVPDPGGGVLAAGGDADHPDDAREEERKNDVHRGAGDGHDHLAGVIDGRELFDGRLARALDRLHVGELGQGDVAAERNPRDAVLDAVLAAPAPDFRAEPEREALNFQAAAACREKVPELMDEDRTTEKEDDESRGTDVGEKGGKHAGGD